MARTVHAFPASPARGPSRQRRLRLGAAGLQRPDRQAARRRAALPLPRRHCRRVRYAVGSGAEIAVRCSGHSVAGHSSTDGGILIDLSLMRGVIVDPSTTSRSSSPGATWRDIDQVHRPPSVWPAPAGGVIGRAWAGSRSAAAVGWLSRTYGLTCDNPPRRGAGAPRRGGAVRQRVAEPGGPVGTARVAAATSGWSHTSCSTLHPVDSRHRGRASLRRRFDAEAVLRTLSGAQWTTPTTTLASVVDFRN